MLMLSFLEVSRFVMSGFTCSTRKNLELATFKSWARRLILLPQNRAMFGKLLGAVP
jgi:hypothetical protein